MFSIRPVSRLSSPTTSQPRVDEALGEVRREEAGRAGDDGTRSWMVGAPAAADASIH